MENWKVMKATVLESAAFSVAKKYISFLLNIPKTVFIAWLKLLLTASSIFFVFVSFILKLVPRQNSCEPPPETPTPSCEPVPETSCPPCELVPETPIPSSELEPESTTPSTSNTEEPKCEVIVENAKKLRKTAYMTLEKFTGSDLFWDTEIIRAKVDRVHRAWANDDPLQIAAAKKALNAHDSFAPKPKTKAEYNRLMREATMDIYDFPDPEPQSTEATEIQHCGRVEGNADVQLMDGAPSSTKEMAKKKVYFTMDKPTSSDKTNEGCQHDCQLAAQNKVLRNRLNLTNCKLEEMLKSSNCILDEVMRLNEQFTKLTKVSSKISTLQYELELGKDVLSEVEAERNEMKMKLVALEKLIKEEEEYLDDMSCESGYEEVEHFCDSTDEL